MTHTDSTDNTNTVNTTKNNTHNNQPQNANTESYSDFMDNMGYFSAFGFLLSRMAYEFAHDRQMSD